ncbi:hypothetical protein LMG19282_01494 [Cupriavidus campinensis]|uniref:DUF5710 domain-containing protein n=1 Tax=Cupriavidus campinensis TaxID=151783 RepID=A0ABY3EJ62_9BURK|nr:DUF5710 domain-containing protein [Cupriavidus campinensis]TSP10979.1 hypothetical protein FGG12_19135 [Cupriavidus campinensis]CAG2138425.1 hypothetical protein LMG19282_01494 [Cupriavidus campinensis]
MTAEKFPTSEVAREPIRKGRRYIFVPYAEKDQASKLGAAFDWKKELWYVPHGVADAPFSRWFEPPASLSDRDLSDQFARACEAAGLVLDGPPVMDGSWQNTKVSTSRKATAKKGAYRAILNGKATNGYIVNFDTGSQEPWFPEGIVLTDADRDKQRTAMEQNRAQRESDTAAEQVSTAERSAKRWKSLPEARDDHPYLAKKQVSAHGLRQDGDRLITALRDELGRIWSLQSIDPKGSKLYEKNGKKTGNFHVLGDLTQGKTVLFGEGYATCASLHEATGLPVVEVFDGGNIGPVVAKLAPMLPGRTILICGDDDVLTPDRVLSTINKVANTDFSRPKLQLNGGIKGDEICIDGTPRSLSANPRCTLRLSYERSPEGVQRIVGEFANSETGKQVAVKILNTGREKALAAAAAHGALTAFPTFQSLDGSPTDFNDLHAREGIALVRRQVGLAMMGKSAQPDQRTPEEVARATIGANATLEPARDNRQYVGTVVGNTPSHAVQSVGKLSAVAHDLARLDRVPAVGHSTKIAYAEGKGRVEGQQSLQNGRIR